MRLSSWLPIRAESGSLLYSILREHRDQEVRVEPAAGADHVLAGVAGRGVGHGDDRLRVAVDVTALHDQAQRLSRVEEGGRRPDLDLDRDHLPWAQPQLAPVLKPGLLRVRALGVQLS